MATTLSLSPDLVASLAPDDSALSAARGLVKSKSFLKPGISADGTWLLAQCKGSGKVPYEVSCDVVDPSNPTCRCTCPSRKFPCKHSLGLLLLYAQAPDQFGAREPSDDLVSKREKKVAREEKKATAGPAAPKKVNQAALQKKITAQRDGLNLLEKLVVDLVAGGQWCESARLDKLQKQAKQLADAYLPAAMHVVRQLVLVGQDDSLSDEERMAVASGLIARIWATVQKGRNYLENKLSTDESQTEADAVVEEVLGKAWQLTELAEKGHVRKELALLELAFERTDDQARQQRVEVSHLLDLKEGAVHQAIAYRPFKGMNQIPEQPSYGLPLLVPEAAVYPGFMNRRVRWDKNVGTTEELTPAHLKKAYGHAQAEFKPALDAYRQQLKHPLAPREGVVLLRCAQLGKVGERVVLEDKTGARIEAVDRRKDYSNVANLVRAGGMMAKEQPAVLARLFVLPLPNTIVAEPLAILTAKQHLRLGI